MQVFVLYHDSTVTLYPQSTICKDCVYAFFCGPCSWCQVAREIKTRMSPIIFVSKATWWHSGYAYSSYRGYQVSEMLSFRPHYSRYVKSCSVNLLMHLKWEKYRGQEQLVGKIVMQIKLILILVSWQIKCDIRIKSQKCKQISRLNNDKIQVPL